LKVTTALYGTKLRRAFQCQNIDYDHEMPFPLLVETESKDKAPLSISKMVAVISTGKF